MKNYQEYDFQRTVTKNNETQSNCLHTDSNTNKYNNLWVKESSNVNDTRIAALEKRIDLLEKKLRHYEEMLNMKNNELTKYQLDSNLLTETYQRITQLEETYYQLTTPNDYTIRKIDVENIVNEKVKPLQVNINSKLSDLTIMIKDLSQYNSTQQNQFTDIKDIFTNHKESINENACKIQELTQQFLSILNMFNENSNEEELFLQNLCDLKKDY